MWHARTVAGARQAPSTRFDPAPQFAIHAIQTVDDVRLVVTGRCFFEPVRIGSVFTQVAAQDDGGWAILGSCRLEVESIALYYLYVDQLEQTHSARVWLTGSSEHVSEPGESGSKLLLVGDTPPDGEWAWDGRLWSRAGNGE